VEIETSVLSQSSITYNIDPIDFGGRGQLYLHTLTPDKHPEIQNYLLVSSLNSSFLIKAACSSLKYASEPLSQKQKSSLAKIKRMREEITCEEEGIFMFIYEITSILAC
jgi:hypothetical protein